MIKKSVGSSAFLGKICSF